MADVGVVHHRDMAAQAPAPGTANGQPQVNGQHGAPVSAEETISDLQDKQAHGAA